MKKLYPLAPLVLIAMVVLLQGCSAKKNTAGSRFWQALNTRYNVYYHGKTNYDEQIKILEDEYQDDYSQRLFVHPAEAKANPKAPQPGGSFDRTIEKMQKAIALHSIKKKPKRTAGKGNDPKFKEWMKREEYNPFLHNAWYLLAKSEYMKGDFLNAAATFRYISRHFTWKQDLALEAKVWEALCYCALGWTNEADNVLAHIHIDRIDNNRIRSLANLAMADYNIKEKRNDRAIPYLEEALDGAKGSQKVRLNFLLGQLYEDAGNNAMAYQAYKKAGSSNSSSYRTKFNARIKQSAVYTGYNVTSEVKALRNMARYDRNKEYLDQIYYAIGNLYLSRQDTARAIDNYVKAAEKSTRNGVDKAISQLTLGGIYFAQHKYDKAQPCYAEAIPQLNDDYPNYKMLKQRSDVLDELSVYAQNVTLQDSLLRLSEMPLDQQKKVIKKIIDELKKKEKEEKEAQAREEYMAQQGASGNSLGNKGNQPTTFQMNNDKSWYFYNTATKAAGKTAFQQTWGNRKLEDNWRRRNKATSAILSEEDDTDAPTDTTTATAGDSTKVDKEALKRAEDPHYEEYYLKQIPTTEEQIREANDIIMEGLYNMGVILKDKLEDLEASEYQFRELMRRYPDNIHRLDTYYNLYLMYMRYGQESSAETYRDLILTEFADSKYGQAMKDPNYLDNLKNMEVDQENMYAQAYANYLANNNEAVHQAYAEMMRKYPLSKIMPKFMFIDALSYVTQKRYDKFKDVLKEMLQRYPETDITPVASGIMKQLNAGRKLTGGSSNTRGMLWSTRLSNDSTGGGNVARDITPFKDEPNSAHLFVLPYDVDSVSSNLLLYQVARHNFNSFVVKDYDLEQLTFGRLGMLVVKGFASRDEAVHYQGVFEADKDMNLPDSLRMVIISEANFKLLTDEGRTLEEYFNWVENGEDAAVESKVPELEEVKKQNEKLEQEANDAQQPAADGKTIKVQVKKGDKLDKLAKRYGVSVDDIKAANGLLDDKIEIGQTLLIPKPNKKAKVDDKKTDKKVEDKQTDTKKVDDKKTDEKKADTKKADEKKAREDARKAEQERKRQFEEQRAREEAETRALEDGNTDVKDDKTGSTTDKKETEGGIGNGDEKTSDKSNSRAEMIRKQREKQRAEREAREKNKGNDEKNVDSNKDEKTIDPKKDKTKTIDPKKDDKKDDVKKSNDKKDDKKVDNDEKNTRSVKNTKDKNDEKAQQRKDEQERKKQEAEAKRKQDEAKKQREAERKRQQDERKKQREAEKKRQQEEQKAEQKRLEQDIKERDRQAQAADAESMKALKEREKVDKKRAKELKKIEKQRQDSIKKAEKAAEKLLAKQQKQYADSIARVEQAYLDSVNAADEARANARKQKQADKYQQALDEKQAKIDARKQAEKERKERIKAREQERKQKMRERKEREKEREQARKEREKQRKAEAKEREKLQKEKAKQREQERKQKQREREEARKQREQSRRK